MQIEIQKPTPGRIVLYRHGRNDVPAGTPEVVPALIYYVSDGVPDMVAVLAYDAWAVPLAGIHGTERNGLPWARYAADAASPGTWCYPPMSRETITVEG
jgi:hypothetical protein